MKNKKFRVLLVIIFLVFLIGIIKFFDFSGFAYGYVNIYNYIERFNASINNNVSSLDNSQTDSYDNNAIISFVSYDLGVQAGSNFLINDSKDEYAMRLNTWNLQSAIDELSKNGGGTIKLPAGTFYFSYGGDASENSYYPEKYAIKPRNNVLLIGNGVTGNDATILKPYNNAISNICDPGIDMFYFNNYADSGFESDKGEKYFNNFSDKYDANVNISWKYLNSPDSNEFIVSETKKESLYLINADFKNFVVDGEENDANCYTSAGKAFMINLFKDCDWDNVVVKNINATGFGMDSPINSTITNCKAINCGKYARIYYPNNNLNLEMAPGGSGFGIGAGTSNDESILIDNCIALNNAKFGFFFEHQGRFKDSADVYGATMSQGYIVKNSYSGGNMYDFGGLQANDVIYDNVVSVSGQSNYSNISLNENKYPTLFTLFSKNNHFINSNFSNNIDDVSDFRDEVKWAVNNGILNASKGTSFEPSSNVSRFDALLALYRYNNMTGSVLNYNPVNYYKELKSYFSSTNITDAANIYPGINLTNSTIVLDNYKYARDLDTVKWGLEKNLILRDNNFDFDSMCTRETIVIWLYKMAGSPSVSNTINFDDVDSNDYFYDAVRWAVAKGITDGTSENNFSPDDKITKLQLAIFLYRYNKLFPNTYKVSFDKNGGIGTMSDLSLKYEESEQLTPNTFTREGYTFNNWNTNKDGTGTDYIDKQTVKYLTTRESITLYAKWKANNYIIKFDKNGGTGTMSDLTMTYDISKNLTSNAYTNTGYIFVGWNTKADGSGASYENEESVKNLANSGSVTLYAIWKNEAGYIINNYSVDETNRYISRIVANTDINNFTSNIILDNGYGIDVDTKEINNKKILYTGGKTRITKGSDLYREYTNIVIGDINGDGKINVIDIVNTADIIANNDLSSVDKVKYYASDYNNDNNIDVIDITKIIDKIVYNN